MNNNCKSILLNTTSAAEFIPQLIGKSSSATSNFLSLYSWLKRELKTKLLSSLCQELDRIIAQWMHNIVQVVRDGIFLVQIAPALSSSTNIWFLLQSEGCNTDWGASRPGHPMQGSSSLTSGRDRDGLIPSLQPKPHCSSAVLINTSQMWWNWPNTDCREGDISTAGTRWGPRGYACMFVWAVNAHLAWILGIYLPFLLGNNTQHGESCRWFVPQCSGTCPGVSSNPILPQSSFSPP